MSRRIVCKACCDKRGPMHPEDVCAGFKRRIVLIKAKRPANHEVKFYIGDTLESLKLDRTESLPSLMCDDCGLPINDGQDAAAITMWRGNEPAPWEKEYSQ